VADGPNVFARLHKWAVRQDENFLTESLAVVLEQLLLLAPEVGIRLVSRLTGGFIDVLPDEADSIVVRTQVETGQGRPDLEISAPHRLLWMEVKAESALRPGQLEGYRELLKTIEGEAKRLVLLTRYREAYSSEDARPDQEIRWFEVADWMESELLALEASGAVAGFLAQQFLDFLRARGMNLTQVGKYLPDGLRAMGSLLNMLFEAAAACKVSARVSAGREFNGISLDGAKYSLGMAYAQPEELWFGTRGRIDPEAAARLPVGEVTEESWIPGRYRWSRSVDLNSPEVHFYSRTKVGQLEWLESFLRECLDMARSIETPDQPPIPEEPEGT
jgi:hypothetical protein